MHTALATVKMWQQMSLYNMILNVYYIVLCSIIGQSPPDTNGDGHEETVCRKQQQNWLHIALYM